MQKMSDKAKKTEEIKEETKSEVGEEVQKEEAATDQCCGRCKSDEKKCEDCEEYKTKYLRAIADYQNYERRVQDQRIEWAKTANKNVILKLLTFLDDLERAEVFVKDANLAHIKDSFSKLLMNEGLEEIDVLGKPYDPYNAEVIDMKEGEEDNVVIAVLRKGYTYNGQLLRVAQVTVSKKAVS
ncbi:MAG: nucleotide exchange factor GrpE [Candidatus Paceibacterota bacterium]